MDSYRQILNLRTLVLKFSIFGNTVKYQEVKGTERSEGYRQIRKLRTSVLNFCIFGNDVKYQEFKTAERSEGVLKFGASRYLTSVLHGIDFII